MLDLEGRGNRRAGRSVTKPVYMKGKGPCCVVNVVVWRRGEIKLEWFVGKANWDRVRTEKCGIVDGNHTLQ